MMNKIGSTAFLLVMVLSCAVVLASAPVDAADRDMQLSIGTVNSQAGATSVDVDVSIDKNAGFWGSQIEISYDSSLTLTKVTSSGMMEAEFDTDYSSPYHIFVQNKSLENNTAIGKLLTLTFSVASSAPDTMPISFVEKGVVMYNYDEDQLFPTLVDGAITIGAVEVPVTGVALDRTEAALDVGGSFVLTPIIAPTNATNKSVTWSSSNSQVATVNNGVVNAVGYGDATVTVTTEDGAKTSTCKVSVQKAATPVTGVTLDKTSMTLKAGSSDSLTATVLPNDATNKSVTWSSSNSQVATVNNGVVTARAEGTAVITVLTLDGSKTATCTVTVEKGSDTPVPVTGVRLDRTSIALDVGKKQTLVATVSPENATDKGIIWSSSNSQVATVSNGVVTAVSEGSATITATTSSGGYAATCTVTVNEPAPSPVSGDNTMLYLGIVIAIIIALLLVIVLMKKKNKI